MDHFVGRAGELYVETGIEHIGGGHALVDEARLRADDFGQMGQEGDDVMLCFALDLVDPRHVENHVAGLGPYSLGGFLRDDPEFRQRVSRMRLDLELDLEPRLGVPDGSHFRAGIAGDHRRLVGFEGLRRDLAERAGGDKRRPRPFRAALKGSPRAPNHGLLNNRY